MREALEKSMQARLARLRAAELLAHAEVLEAEALEALHGPDVGTACDGGAQGDVPVLACPHCGTGLDGLRDMTTMGATRRALFCVTCARVIDGGPLAVAAPQDGG